MDINDKIAEIISSQIKHNGLKDWDKLYNDIQCIIEYQKRIHIDNTCRWLEQRLAFGVHPCNGMSVVAEYEQEMTK